MTVATSDPGVLYPFTLVFAAHLAIFGASRMASDFPARSINAVVAEAIVKSWLMFFVPFVATVGVSRASVLLGAVASMTIAMGTLLFAASEARRETLRNTSQDVSRWVRQAASAGTASLLGWMVMEGVRRWMAGE